MSARHAAGDGSFGRSASGAAARGAFLLAIAVILGVLLLHAFDRGSGAFNASLRTTPSPQPSVTFLPSATTSTQPLRAPAAVKVLPANGTATKGAGTKTGDRLKTAGYNVLAATNTTKPATTSSVQFAAGFEREARVVAQLLGLADSAVQPIPTPPPVPDLLGANLLVIVGPDLAGRAAPATTATTKRTTATTAAPATTARPATTTTTR
jgi:LytR cell envelope-related transcriptional attenuator